MSFLWEIEKKRSRPFKNLSRFFSVKVLNRLWASLIQKLVKIQTGQNHLDAIQRELRSPKKSVLVINTHRNVGTYARTRTHTHAHAGTRVFK